MLVYVRWDMGSLRESVLSKWACFGGNLRRRGCSEGQKVRAHVSQVS